MLENKNPKNKMKEKAKTLMIKKLNLISGFLNAVVQNAVEQSGCLRKPGLANSAIVECRSSIKCLLGYPNYIYIKKFRVGSSRKVSRVALFEFSSFFPPK